MSQTIINIGSAPNSGDGEPLRTAFDVINQNFTELYSNVSALSNSVPTVAGRTGPITLTVQDIVGLNSYQLAPIPSTSFGHTLDTIGSLAFDATYIYYCTQSYTNGMGHIWKRVAWSSDTW